MSQIPKFSEETLNQLAYHYKEILTLLGEDPAREGLVKTPIRVAKSMDFLTHGYRQDPKAILESALFHEDYKQIVVVKDIEIYSLCEHHMLPFLGKAHIGYIPNGTIVGLSKIPRVVEFGHQQLQVFYTPGHCEGSICLYSAENKVIFTGDVIFEMCIGRSDLPTGNEVQLQQSIREKILTLPDDVVILSGHGDATTVGHEREGNMYIWKN